MSVAGVQQSSPKDAIDLMADLRKFYSERFIQKEVIAKLETLFESDTIDLGSLRISITAATRRLVEGNGSERVDQDIKRLRAFDGYVDKKFFAEAEHLHRRFNVPLHTIEQCTNLTKDLHEFRLTVAREFKKPKTGMEMQRSSPRRDSLISDRCMINILRRLKRF